MSHFLTIICFLIIFVSIQLVYGSTHGLIGNYSQLNPKDCGITRFTPNLDYSCFKWHNNIFRGMKGRNATKDEVPWIIYLERRTPLFGISLGACTASLIADQWVLAAAHCIHNDDPKNYYIYAGIDSFGDSSKTYLARANFVIKHPDYRDGPPTFNDIALIRLDRSILSIKPVKSSEQLNHFKSICLPQNNVFNGKQEFALFGGWGKVDRNEWPLQVGIVQIYPSDDYSFAYSSNYFGGFNKENITILCKGDSGGPLWQYDSGRAVLIGVLSWSTSSDSTGCNPTQGEHATFFVRVSKYIDWIKNVTKLN